MKFLSDLGIEIENIELLTTALTHSSYSNEAGGENYERLEFLGDSVLQLIMSEYFYKNHDLSEGDMSKTRASYVCENALYEYSIRLGLNEYILLGKGELESGGKFRKAIVADVFEAFLGAMFLDQGIETCKKFVYKHIIPLIESKEIDFFSDYKSVLQELVQTDKRSLEYVIVNEEGPSHNKTFTVEVKIDNILYGRGTAHSKKEAEQEAAKDALKKAQNGD